jgi:hypothetical protein
MSEYSGTYEVMPFMRSTKILRVMGKTSNDDVAQSMNTRHADVPNKPATQRMAEAAKHIANHNPFDSCSSRICASLCKLIQGTCYSLCMPAALLNRRTNPWSLLDKYGLAQSILFTLNGKSTFIGYSVYATVTQNKGGKSTGHVLANLLSYMSD